MATNDAMAGEQASPERAAEQQGAGWPRPGEEGYVHPDGTPQAARQLEENRQAAADRAAAGSVVHGAPSLGGNLGKAAGVAEKRADAYSGKSVAEAGEDLAAWVDEKRTEVVEEDSAAEDSAPAKRPASKPESRPAS